MRYYVFQRMRMAPMSLPDGNLSTFQAGYRFAVTPVAGTIPVPQK